MLGGLFPFAQMMQGGRNPRFARILEQLDVDAPAHVHMVRGMCFCPFVVMLFNC